jgi:hypothetical protein
MRDLKGINARGDGEHKGLFVTLFLGLLLVIVPAVAAPSPGGEGGKLPSENTAFVISILGAALGPTISGPGFLVGPSLGFFYGGCWGKGLAHVGLRAVAMLVVLAALLSAELGDVGEETKAAFGVAGVCVYLGSVIWDLATVKKAVRKRNAAVGARKGLDVSLAPFILAKAKGAGIRMQLSF